MADNSPCPPVCVMCQGFCQSGSADSDQTVASHIGYANAPSVARDDLIIKKMPKSELQRLLSWLEQGSRLGSRKNSGAATYSLSSSDFITSEDISGVLSVLRSLNDANPVSPPSRDQPIYASWFQSVFDAINNARTDYDACNRCNVGCDDPCLSCG